MKNLKESEMFERMKNTIDNLSHKEFVELYIPWFPIQVEIDWDESGPE